MPARVLGAKRHMNVHRDWCRAWLDAVTYTLPAMQADTHTQAFTHLRTKKGAERQRQRKACHDDLGFSHSSATALLLNGGRRFHMHAHTCHRNTHAPSF